MPNDERERERASWRAVIRQTLAMTDVLEGHKRRCVRHALLYLTRVGWPRGIRYWSVAARAQSTKPQHEHVYRRAVMAEALLMAAPNEVDAILDQAVACAVTASEHARLTQLDRELDLDGWARYLAAGVPVVDLTNEGNRST